MRKNTNLDQLDLLKLILSVMVVMLHSQFPGPWRRILFPAVRLAVPMFFMMTGYFAFRTINSVSDPVNRWGTVKKLLLRLLRLYGFWFVVQFPYILALRKYFQHGFWEGMRSMVRGFLFGSTFNASWYLMACVLGILIVFLLSRRFGTRALVGITTPFFLFATFVSEAEPWIRSAPGWSQAYGALVSVLGTPYLNFIMGLLYIVLGKMLAEGAMEQHGKGTCFGLFCLSWVLLLAERHFLMGYDFFSYQCDSCFFLAPAAFFLLSLIMKMECHLKYARTMRSLSTIIYCSHGAAIAVVMKGLSIGGIYDPYHLGLFLGTILLSAAVAFVLLGLEKRGGIFRVLSWSH